MPGATLLSRVCAAGVVVDVKASLNLPEVKAGGYSFWRL